MTKNQSNNFLIIECTVLGLECDEMCHKEDFSIIGPGVQRLHFQAAVLEPLRASIPALLNR